MSLKLTQGCLSYPGGFRLELPEGLCLKNGQIGVLTGPNGSGKSSLLRSIVGFRPVFSGRVFLLERSVHRLKPVERFKAGLRFVLQGRRQFQGLTVGETWELSKFTATQSSDWEKLKRKMAINLGQEVRTLSGGQAKLVQTGAVIGGEPSVILFDEPFAGMGQEETQAFESLVKDLAASGMSLLISEHRRVTLGDTVIRFHIHQTTSRYVLKRGNGCFGR